MAEFHDRRPNALPLPEDFETPLTHTNLIEANRRFRESGVTATVGTDPVLADKLVRKTTKSRFNARRKGQEEFSSVGEYLQYLHENVGR